MTKEFVSTNSANFSTLSYFKGKKGKLNEEIYGVSLFVCTNSVIVNVGIFVIKAISRILNSQIAADSVKQFVCWKGIIGLLVMLIILRKFQVSE